MSGYVKLTYNSEVFPPALYSAPVALLVAVIKTETLILLFVRALVQYVLGMALFLHSRKRKTTTAAGLEYRPQNGASVLPTSATAVVV